MQKFPLSVLISAGMFAAMPVFAQYFAFAPAEEKTHEELLKKDSAEATQYKLARLQIFVCKNPPRNMAIPVIDFNPKHLSADERKYVSDCLRGRR